METSTIGQRQSDTIQLGPYQIDRDPAAHRNPPLFIAEIGINHGGDLRRAMRMIAAAGVAGANIVKFQTHIPEAEMLPGHPLWDILSQCQLSESEHRQLQQYANECGVMFLSTPFSIEAADLLESIGVQAYKLGSGELTNLPLQEHVAKFGKPMLVSTGMSTLAEVDTTALAIGKYNRNFVVMNCTSAYPCSFNETRLRRIEALRAMLGRNFRQQVPIGQSDHSPTVSSALGAIALGACVIEKHFTLDKTWEGPDQAASLLPVEFAAMVEMGLEIWEGLADPGNGVLESEAGVMDWAHHRIVTTRDVKRMELVTAENTSVKRSSHGYGIAANRYDKILNTSKRFTVDLPDDSPVSVVDIY